MRGEGYRIFAKGFTLLELLVVIAIIGLLSTVVLASLNSARAGARDAARLTHLRQVQTALEMRFLAGTSYPLGSWHTAELWTSGLTPRLVGEGFLAALPLDPLNTGVYIYRYYSNYN